MHDINSYVCAQAAQCVRAWAFSGGCQVCCTARGGRKACTNALACSGCASGSGPGVRALPRCHAHMCTHLCAATGAQGICVARVGVAWMWPCVQAAQRVRRQNNHKQHLTANPVATRYYSSRALSLSAAAAASTAASWPPPTPPPARATARATPPAPPPPRTASLSRHSCMKCAACRLVMCM